MIISFLEASNTQIEAEIGRRIRRRRVELQLNQTELAERAGVARRTVSSVERGEGASLSTFVALLRGLGALGDLELVLPDPGVSPIALTEGPRGRVRERKYPYKPRGKKREKGNREPDSGKPWRWEDEK